MKCGVVTFHDGGKVGRSDATPIIFFSYYGHILVKFCDNFEGSGSSPSYFPTLIKWSLLVLPLIPMHLPHSAHLTSVAVSFDQKNSKTTAHRTQTCT